MATGSYTYPLARPSGTLTAAQVHQLLSNPRVIAKRVQKLTDQRFIADYLLGQRFEAKGGGIFYETGETLFAPDSSEAVEALMEYPLTVLPGGDIAAAATRKQGLGTEISDEKISRDNVVALDRGLSRIANQVVKDVDSIAMAVVIAKITDTYASSAWSSIANIVTGLLAAQAAREDLALGINADTIALTGAQWAKVMGLFASAGVLPREAGNPLVNGNYPVNLLGYTWVTSPWITGGNPLLVDREQLGGMANEDLQSPDWVKSPDSDVETYVKRLDGRDGYRAIARRVTVPVVTEAHAGVAITGTGL
jgi:hypothetical protein